MLLSFVRMTNTALFWPSFQSLLICIELTTATQIGNASWMRQLIRFHINSCFFLAFRNFELEFLNKNLVRFCDIKMECLNISKGKWLKNKNEKTILVFALFAFVNVNRARIWPATTMQMVMLCIYRCGERCKAKPKVVRSSEIETKCNKIHISIGLFVTFMILLQLYCETTRNYLVFVIFISHSLKTTQKKKQQRIF